MYFQNIASSNYNQPVRRADTTAIIELNGHRHATDVHENN